MESVEVAFVGGPLDGRTGRYPIQLGAIQIPVTVDGATRHYRYAQADLIDSAALAQTPSGQLRFVFVEEAAGA